MFLLKLCALGAAIIFVFVVDARPVSYPTGTTLMLSSDAMRHSLHWHYSPSASTSVGYRAERWRDAKVDLHLLQINHLVRRWNKRDSQANIYIKSAVGMSRASNQLNNDIGGFIGIAADWEDRRYFLAYSNRYTRLNDDIDFFTQSMRIGWAPYEGSYGELHTWLMLQVEHLPENDDTTIITPLLRLFKGAHLGELGMSNQGDLLMNYIYRF